MNIEEEEDFTLIEMDNNKKNFSYFDFNKPNYLPNTILNAVKSLHNKLVPSFNTNVSSLFKKIVEIKLYSFEYSRYSDYVNSLEYNTNINTIILNNSKQHIIFDCDFQLCSKVINDLLNGQIDYSDSYTYTSNFSDIENEILSLFFNETVNTLKNSWKEYLHLDLKYKHEFLDIENINSLDKDSEVIIIKYEICIEDKSGHFTLCYPISYFEKIFKSLEKKNKQKLVEGSHRKLLQTYEYSAVEIEIKTSDCFLGNTIKFDNDLKKSFSFIKFKKLIPYTHILHDIKVSTNEAIYSLKVLMKELVKFPHLYNEPLNILINDLYVGKGNPIILEEGTGIEFVELDKNYKNIIDNLYTHLYIIFKDNELFLSQDNRVLFKLEEVDINEGIYKLIDKGSSRL